MTTTRIGRAPARVHEIANNQAEVLYERPLRDLTGPQQDTCYEVAWEQYGSEGGR